MRDLVAVPAQNELTRLFQQRQHQGKLHLRQVAHFVDDDEVADRRLGLGDLASPSVGHQVAVVQASLGQPRAVALELAVRELALGWVEQVLAGPLRQIG